MANLTDAYENEVLDGLTGVTALTTPATVYLALFTASPTDTGSVTNELSGGGYARKSLSGLFSASTGGSSSNTSAIDFAVATADWTAVTHMGIMESGTATTDDMMVWMALDSSVTITDTNTFSVAVGDLTITAQ